MTTKQILSEARRLLAEVGWCQGAMSRYAGGADCALSAGIGQAVSYCSIGAIEAAILNVLQIDRNSGRFARLLNICRDRVATTLKIRTPVSRWNDNPKRTKAEVLAAFDRAIEAAP